MYFIIAQIWGHTLLAVPSRKFHLFQIGDVLDLHSYCEVGCDIIRFSREHSP